MLVTSALIPIRDPKGPCPWIAILLGPFPARMVTATPPPAASPSVGPRTRATAPGWDANVRGVIVPRPPGGGRAAGATPPVLGWTAVTGELHSDAILLFLIIFVWTPPHFWALAIAKKDEYERVGIPMLPVTHGNEVTRKYILFYTALLVFVTILPYVTGMSGLIYLAAALALGGRFLYYAIRLRSDDGVELPMRVFRYSINYLMILYAALLIDHYFTFRLAF